ncbi:hypothetical protein Y032_0020g120 [Ancylostoma ceylanicum]|uniref:Uncharacterized protein n=1 Tax=Ancylostoma ceylanicum TaxID=53326 RepID=A0A016V1I1_9BILA|nr:hypothetical protein Y032_0020g120 [Ancylostoma ceylanicum]
MAEGCSTSALNRSLSGTNLLTHVCGHFRAYATVDENPINNFSSGRLEPSNEVMNTIVHLPAEHPSIGLLSGRI